MFFDRGREKKFPGEEKTFSRNLFSKKPSKSQEISRKTIGGTT